MMGYSYYWDDGPSQCFNGAKSWWLGWYSDGHVTVDTESLSYPSFEGKLIGVDDYKKGKLGNDKMIIKIEGNSTLALDYYVMFNVAKGINWGVLEGRNQVMITSRAQWFDFALTFL